MPSNFSSLPTPDHSSAQPWLDHFLQTAIAQHFSDLYFKPSVDGYRLSGQARGELRFILSLSHDFAERLLSIIKYHALLNLAEKRRPQLGRFTFQGHFVRVSSVGDFLGRESIVLRIIYPDLGEQRFIDDRQMAHLSSEQPDNGLYLLSGPTGAGKTSTLYRLLHTWSKGRVVLTVEDPVEYYQPDYLQLQVNADAGIFYEDLIKVALRQRPDILVIGEIRDGKTAAAALQAALSGHLVLSTIHANSASMVINRLIDLGLDLALVQAALVKTVYQRLVRNDEGELAATLSWIDWREGEVTNVSGIPERTTDETCD
ncbi:Flp pilus assembly complex ATPase component TadA [Fructobacillus sp. M2-14]|uniref:Flp pilus assembly complex ATPase component TadA n=1 Tax=Fructobacillus broussonetiae TaxID=2713173 RepID=A0ABS5QZZ2_9LACO|nr:ATPase, T2SS/T4P/T4SS family [Fructobacillus broussonetiae]MBS9338751.1 Flp pilus assembly complex ATPase component TadA [Fructobacillus broussonetiae]